LYGLCNPTALALDKENNLYVSDTNNNRVLEYSTPLAESSGVGSGDTIADAVLGQSSFVMNVCVGKLGGSMPANANGLCSPSGIVAGLRWQSLYLRHLQQPFAEICALGLDDNPKDAGGHSSSGEDD
jgi:hypothetical protein